MVVVGECSSGGGGYYKIKYDDDEQGASSSTCHSIKFKMRGEPSKTIWYNLTLILMRKMSKRKASEISITAEILPTTISTAALTAKKCRPYLSTVNRKVLDFDFERRCSVTLNYNHVYVCMVCGKFFRGVQNSRQPTRMP